MNHLQERLKELQNECEKKQLNYSLFIGRPEGTLSGAANLTLKEIAVLVENLARSLSAEQIQFLQHILSLVIKEKQELPPRQSR